MSDARTPAREDAPGVPPTDGPLYAVLPSRAVQRPRLDADGEGTRFNIFLVEDHEDVAVLIRKSLERVGHQVTRCKTAADALIVLAQSAFDLVVLDYVLPDMEGLELLQRLASEGISVPVLMITAHGNEQLATRALQAGALDYLVKDTALTFLGELPKRVAESVRRHRLEHLNQLLIQSLESARDGIMITDLQGVILKVNQALEQQTGYTRQELCGQTPRLLKSGRHPPEFYTRMWQTVLARQSWQGELSNRRKDGQLRQTSMTISPIVDGQGRLTHFVGIQRDITEHKRLEQEMLQMQKMQSVGTLAGGIAHEFNNLMAGINGYASLGLREGGLNDTLKQFLHHIVDLSERAATLTRQLLAYARKPALSQQRTEIAGLLKATADLVGRTLHQEVELDLPTADGGLPLAGFVVEADANQLQQALVNLALNARDAIVTRKHEAFQVTSSKEPRPTPPPSEKVIIRLRHVVSTEEKLAFPQKVPAGDYLHVLVQDQGCGMTQEVMSQALDPFFTTKEVGQGTGLGLPMVFGIVQGHQGFLTIETGPMQGTSVGLYLPRYTEPAADGRGKAHLYGDGLSPWSMDEVMEPDHAPGRAILVIDDEEPVLDVVRRFLEIAGHQVTCASSGQQGVEQLTAGKAIDLIVLDLMMPREDAQVTFQRLRQIAPEVPVLLCTGLAESQTAPWLLRQSRTALLRKPFRMNELWHAVSAQLVNGRGEG